MLKARRPRMYYNGDVNIEHGGYFYNLENIEWGYAECVRVTPCSDAGAPDNCYWIELLTVNIPDKADKIKSALDSYGYDVEDLKLPDAWHKTHMLIEASIAHGTCDRELLVCVQVGPKSEYGEPIEADYVLRSNASLRNHARLVFNRGY